MSTTLIPPPTPVATPAPEPAIGPTLAWTIACVSDAVASIPPNDERWAVVGPRLTAFVDTARRAIGLPPSPIGVHDDVAPVLRLRDLGRLAQAAIGSGVGLPSTAEIDERVRSVQVAVDRGTSDA